MFGSYARASLGHIARITQMRPIATDVVRVRSVACVSECRAHRWSPQERINRPILRLRADSAVTETEFLQPHDLACGTLFQSSCVIRTSPTDCSDDSWRDTFFGKYEHCALWLPICGAIEKHLLTYLLTRVGSRNHYYNGSAHWRCLAITTGRSVCGCDAALCQMTLITCPLLTNRELSLDSLEKPLVERRKDKILRVV